MDDVVRMASALRTALDLPPRLDFEVIKQELNLAVVEVDSDSFDGALLRAADGLSGRILVRRGIRGEGRKRFTIAHEVGHFVLHRYERQLSCGAAEIEHWEEREVDPEHDADLFASELLLPSAGVRVQIGKEWPSLDLLGGIAEFFGASLTAAARKYCDVASQNCAVVWSEKGEIRWFHPSGRFSYWIPVGSQVGFDSVAAHLISGRTVAKGMTEIAADEWIDSNWLADGTTLFEESVHMPQYNGCLSLLWVKHEIEQRPKDSDGLLEELDPTEFTLERRKWPGKHRRR